MSLLTLPVLLACKGGGKGTDDSSTAVDDTSDSQVIDTGECLPGAYPSTADLVDIKKLDKPVPLTLDGSGTRCDQMTRALFDPATGPSVLAQFDTTGATVDCSHDDLTDNDLMRVQNATYAGLPLFLTTQSFNAYVSPKNEVVQLYGSYIAKDQELAEACLTPAAAAAAAGGATLLYVDFDHCILQPGEFTYTLQGDDALEPGDEGVLIDGDGQLRRVIAVNAYVAPSNVTPSLRQSDLCCCLSDFDHCLGETLYVDAITAEIVGTGGYCIVC